MISASTLRMRKIKACKTPGKSKEIIKSEWKSMKQKTGKL